MLSIAGYKALASLRMRTLLTGSTCAPAIAGSSKWDSNKGSAVKKERFNRDKLAHVNADQEIGVCNNLSKLYLKRTHSEESMVPSSLRARLPRGNIVGKVN